MTFSGSAPRLLPMTITAMAALLAMKSVGLLRSWPDTGSLIVVGVANAAEHEKKPPDPPAAPPPEPTAPPADRVPPVSDSERGVLLELRERRQELERRDAAVAARESVLAAAQQKLAARVDELKSLQTQLSGLDAARQQREDANWQSLVKLYETMKPREAAAIFNDLAMSVLLPLVAHMKEIKAAPILAAMAPDKARDLTAQLAKSKGRLDPPPEPPPASRPASPPAKS